MWRTRPVFISSTFTDMQAERDHLRTHVFPVLEERLRKRQHYLEWVDLRIGVATASLAEGEARELEALKVCLAEVKRCRPFLIVLLGDRYGWVPPPGRIKAIADEVGFEADFTGRSITDLEISFGVLTCRDQQPRSFFYFRKPLPYGEMPASVAAIYTDGVDAAPKQKTSWIAWLIGGKAHLNGNPKLAAIKKEIETRLPGRVRRYTAGWDRKRQRVTGLEAWGLQVIEDIWAEFDAEIGAAVAAPELSWQQEERNALDDYAEDRARDFAGRQSIVTGLLAHATSQARKDASWGICLTGAPGSGKSAIFGELLRRLRAEGVFILAHAAGASLRSRSVESMLRRWIEELGTALGTDPGLAENDDPETIDAMFRALLARVCGKRRLVLLVDALDQFEDTTQGRLVTWLPHILPNNALFIATAVPGAASEALKQRPGVQSQLLEPLDAAAARSLIEAICARYRRKLEPEVLDALMAKNGPEGSAWGSPLWLVLAVEELNLIDADDFNRATRSYSGAPAERIRALMLDIVADMPNTIPGIYKAGFERAGELFGQSLAQAFIGCIAISRAGWRELDFRALLSGSGGEEWNELRFASLRRIFRGQLRQHGSSGRWDFAHLQMRIAARSYVASVGMSETELHAKAGKHLLKLPREDPLRQSETMVHLIGCADWVRTATFIGEPALSPSELDGGVQILADGLLAQDGVEIGLQHVEHLLNAADNASASLAGLVAERLIFGLDQKINTRASLQVSSGLHRRIKSTFESLARADPGNSDWQRDLSVSHNKVGNVLRSQGNLPAALESYRASLAIADRLARVDPGNAVWQHDVSVAQEKIGDVLMEQGNLPAALESYRASLAIADRLARVDPGNAVWQHDVSVAQEKIGDVLMEQGNLPAALESYIASLGVRDRLVEIDPGNAGWQHGLSVSQERIGDVLRAQGDLSAALESYRASLSIRDHLARADPTNTGWQRGLSTSQEKIGDLLAEHGNLTAALESYRASHAIANHLAKADPGNAYWQYDLGVSNERIGCVLMAQSDLPAALRAFETKREIISRLAKADPSNARWHRDLSVSDDRIGDVLVQQGNLPAALENYRASLAIRDQLARADPGNSGWQRDLLVSRMCIANVLAEQGDLPAALESYRASLAIADRLARADPSNSGWQRDLSVSHNKIGDVLADQSNLPAALESYLASLAIADRLARADPGNAGWQLDVSVSQERIGDVMRAQGNLSAALNTYRASHAILDRLAKADLTNTGWRRSLSVLHIKIGAVLEEQGNLPAALENYCTSRAIFELPGQGRFRQYGLAARCVYFAGKDRRRNARRRQPASSARKLPRLAWHQRPPGKG